MNDRAIGSAQDVADRVEALIQRALDTPAIGRTEGGANRALGSQLRLLATQMQRTWAPDLDVRRALHTLSQSRLRATAAERAAPFVPDTTLGWAPAEHDAIVAAAAAELGRRAEPLATALLEARRARTSAQLASTSLTLELDGRSLMERIEPTALQARRMAELRSAAAEAERLATAAFEAAWTHHHDALRVFAPLSVSLTAGALAALLKSDVDAAEWFLDRRLGVPRYEALGAARSVVLAGLHALRQEVLRAFPAASRGMRSLRGGATASPYRAREVTDESPAETLETDVDRMAPCLESAAVQAEVRGTLDRATTVGLLEQIETTEGPRVGALEGVPGGASFDDAAVDARVAALRAVLQRSARDVVTALAMSHALAWPYRLEHGVLVVHQAFQSLHANGRAARRDASEEPVLNKARAAFTVHEMRRVLGAIFGITVDRGALVDAVAEAIASSAPTEPPRPQADRFLGEAEVTRLVAETLRPTAFLEVYRRIESARREATRLADELTRAEEAVSLFDKINVLTTSETEARRDELRARLEAVEGDGARAAAHAERDVERALAAYPPADLVLRFDEVGRALDRVELVYGLGEEGIIAHQEEAIRALRLWSMRAGAVIRVPPPGALLEEHAARCLGGA